MSVIDLESGAYLIAHLFAAGPTALSAMGELPLSWMDIYGYMGATSNAFEPWESILLHDLSVEYLEGKRIGEDPLGIAPADMD